MYRSTCGQPLGASQAICQKCGRQNFPWGWMFCPTSAERKARAIPCPGCGTGALFEGW
jgi:DNA-directed RNA polymerase subunit RPC12/RpoP